MLLLLLFTCTLQDYIRRVRKQVFFIINAHKNIAFLMRPKHVAGIPLLLLLLKHFGGTPMALNASDIFIRNKQRARAI